MVTVLPSHAQWYTSSVKKLDVYRQLNGEIEAVNKATVSAQTAGRVAKLNYDVDDIVTKGSILVEFTNTEQKSALQQAKANAKAADVGYQQAIMDYQRTKEIYAKNLIAKSALDKALSNRDALAANLKAAQAAVNAATKQFEYTIIRAPYDGIVTKRYVELGETVNPGSKIMEGLSLDRLRVVTYIPEKIINQIKSNPIAVVMVGQDKIPSTDVTIFPYADSMSRTFKARIDIDTSTVQLFPGMTVKVSFKVAEENTLIIPKSALINRSELTMVKVKMGEKSLLRQVKLGQQQGDNVAVISGLTVGERVLIHPLAETLTNVIQE
jgi:RND family efflux transporter MFP subunit